MARKRHLRKLRQRFIANPALYQKPVSDDIRYSLERIIGHLNYDGLFRGDDFYPEFSDKEAMEWLFSEEHSYLYDLGYKKSHSKLGRLGGVIAMHPRRDEIAALITPAIVKDWNKELPPAFLPHISRLLTHTDAPACEDFAMEFLRHPEFWGKTPVNSDGNDCFTFWTYAPYVLANLRQRGKSLTEMMANWCMERKPIGRGNARYPGIEYMYDGIDRYHYLRHDGKSASHTFVNYFAQKAIVPSLEDRPSR